MFTKQEGALRLGPEPGSQINHYSIAHHVLEWLSGIKVTRKNALKLTITTAILASLACGNTVSLLTPSPDSAAAAMSRIETQAPQRTLAAQMTQTAIFAFPPTETLAARPEPLDMHAQAQRSIDFAWGNEGPEPLSFTPNVMLNIGEENVDSYGIYWTNHAWDPIQISQDNFDGWRDRFKHQPLHVEFNGNIESGVEIQGGAHKIKIGIPPGASSIEASANLVAGLALYHNSILSGTIGPDEIRLERSLALAQLAASQKIGHQAYLVEASRLKLFPLDEMGYRDLGPLMIGTMGLPIGIGE